MSNLLPDPALYAEATRICEETADLYEGRVIQVRYVNCYVDDEQDDLYFDPPVPFLVDIRGHALNHWNMDHLDPYWDVTPIGSDPQLPAGASSFWTDGPTIEVTAGGLVFHPVTSFDTVLPCIEKGYW